MKKCVLLILTGLLIPLAFSYSYLPCPHYISSINIPCYINKPGIYNITSNIYFNPTVCFYNNTPFLVCPFILINTSNVVINGNFHKISLKNIATGFIIENKTNITIKNLDFVYVSSAPFFIKNSKSISIYNVSIASSNITNNSVISINSYLLLQNINIRNVNYPLLFYNSKFLLFNSSFKYYQTAIHLINSYGIIYQCNITNGIVGILANDSFFELVNSTLTNNSNGIIINNSKTELENSYVCRNIYDVLLSNLSKKIDIKNCTIGSIFLVKNNVSKKLNKTEIRKLLGWDFYTNNYCGLNIKKVINKSIINISNKTPNLTPLKTKIIINKKYKENGNIVKDIAVIIFIIIVVIIALYFMIFKKI